MIDKQITTKSQMIMRIAELSANLIAKEQESEDLKIKNSILEDEYKILEDNLDSRTRDFEDVIDGYKQTLTEIKDIAEKEVNNRMLFADKESFCDFNKILQKISEVE